MSPVCVRRSLLPPVSLAVLGLRGCGGGSGASFCDTADDFENADLGGDSASLVERVEGALVVLDRLVEEAPDAIVSDVITVRDGVEEFARGRGGLGPTSGHASERVTDDIDQECPGA